MKKYLIALLLGAMAFLVACDDDDNSKPAASRFTVPEAVVDGTTATVSSLADFDGLENLDRGFYYAPITSAGTGEFAHTSAPLVDGAKMSATLVGLDAQTSYKFYAYVVMADGLRYESERAEFKTGDKSSTVVPTFESLAATNVEPTTATINATLAYTGSETIAEVYFLTTIDGAQVRKDVEATVGAKSAALTELKASTEYKFQLVAKIGGVTYASDMTSFTTKTDDPSVVEPTFEGLSSSNVTATSATLSGTFGYTGTKQITAVYFEYKTATGAAQRKDVGSLTAGAKSVDLTELTASTTYTYNLCVEIDGKIYKDTENKTFTTTDEATKAKYSGWVELPAELANSDYYYAYHICPDFKVGGQYARNFTICYSAKHKSPLWVAGPLSSLYVGSKSSRNYGPDPVIPTYLQPSDEDATMGSGYNRGHMMGNHERSASSGMNKQAAYYTNMSAQNSSTFNTGGGAWNNLENKIDSYLCSDTLYVVVGAYFDSWTDSYGNSLAPNKTTSFGNITTSVPTMYYTICLRTKSGNSRKSVLDCSANELKCVAFVMSHAMPKGHKPAKGDMRTVKELEDLTGFTFFTNVPQAPKDTYTASEWGL